MNNIYKPNEALDAVRIRAEVETAHRAQTKRPTWAPAVALDGELLELCRELEFLGPDDKPVARLWAVFADPKGRGRIIRTNYSQHPLDGVRCRGFEMRAGEAHDGGRMTNALMDHDGSWSIGHVSWAHSDIDRMRRWARKCERCIEEIHRALEPNPPPRLTPPEEYYERQIGYGVTPEEAHRRTEFTKRHNAETLEWWETKERKKKDPAYIEERRAREQFWLRLLEKERQKIAKEEAHPDWRYKASTRMTELATQRMLQFVGDPETERRRGAQITSRCACCGKTLTDKISIERGIGPECIQGVRTFNYADLVKLKNEMVAAHPDKGGQHEVFLAAYARYQAAKAAAEGSLLF
jgi:hypothetical protein